MLRDIPRLQLIKCLSTTSMINTEIKSAIIKADIFYHFPILFVAKVNDDVNIKTEKIILNGNVCEQSINKEI